MPVFLCVTVRFLDPRPIYRGRKDEGLPEWPPSPHRLFQATVAAIGREQHWGTSTTPLARSRRSARSGNRAGSRLKRGLRSKRINFDGRNSSSADSAPAIVLPSARTGTKPIRHSCLPYFGNWTALTSRLAASKARSQDEFSAGVCSSGRLGMTSNWSDRAEAGQGGIPFVRKGRGDGLSRLCFVMG
jgi:hypothetical protein